MGLRRVTAPVSYPVTIEEARARCRVIGTEEDETLTALIAAATAFVESYTGRSLMPQTWELAIDAFEDSILLSRGPVTGIESVTYFDVDEVEQTLSASAYALDDVSDPQWLVRATDASWPAVASGVNNVSIRFNAGYAEDAAELALAKQAMLMLIVQWFDNPSTVLTGSIVAPMPHAVDALLTNLRSFS